MPFTTTAALDLFRRAQTQDRLAHAYLFTGPPGAGKRALACEVCRLLHGPGEDPLADSDVHLIEPESKSRKIVIEQLRDLEQQLQMRSFFGHKKIGVLVDTDRLTDGAVGSFLKTLEEPPGNSLLLLLTALPEQLPDTILSRCIEVPLKAPTARELTPLQQRLLAALQAHAQLEKPQLPDVFRLVRAFAELLAEARETLKDETAAAFKKEEQHYKQTSDARGYLEDREEYYDALTEARYRQVRVELLAVLDAWWADVLRHQHGAAALDLPTAAPDTATLAARLTAANCLQRAAALETLREHLNNPGIQEQLAVECSFLKAFG
jgi:DNA polymerase-3 subunit delta'